MMSQRGAACLIIIDMRTLLLGALVVALVGCGKGRTFEGEWTYVDAQGFNVDAKFTSSTIEFKHYFPGHTLISRGVYNSGPESLSLTFQSFEVDDHGKVVSPEGMSRYTNQPTLAVPYKVEWKSNDEFYVTSVLAVGRNPDGSIKQPDVAPLIYKRKK